MTFYHRFKLEMEDGSTLIKEVPSSEFAKYFFEYLESDEVKTFSYESYCK